METDTNHWRSVSSWANGMPCDFCDRLVVGWMRQGLRNRSGGGPRLGWLVYAVCDQHITLGEPVYPGSLGSVVGR